MTAQRSQVLFVDDDANIIASIRRALRTQATSWQVHCANGGREALDIARSTALDAVITDMRMPVMDGATLLAHLQELQPNTVRMVLSGQSDRNYSIAAAKYAHRFLSKPCPAEVLSEQVQATLDARARLNSTGAGDLVGLVQVQVQDGVLGKLEETLATVPFTADAVCNLIKDHAGVSLKLLQLVSSGFFAQKRPTTLLREAIIALGPDVLRSLVQSGLFRTVTDEQQPVLAQCLRTARRRATLAKRIATECQLAAKQHEALGFVSQLGTVNRALRLQPCKNQATMGDTLALAAADAGESAAISQLWGAPEVLGRSIAACASAASDHHLSIEDSILCLAVVLERTTPQDRALQRAGDNPVLEPVLSLKSIEDWEHSASSWCREEGCL